MTSARSRSPRRPSGSSSRPPAPARGGWPVRERSLLRPVLGIPPLAAVGLAVGTTALGVLVDLLRIGTVGRIFEVGYLLGCVLAVCWVRRRSIFVPAVQPPLLLAVVVPVVAMLLGAPSGGGAAQSLLMAGAPLINAFPAMAVTTAVVLLIAGYRVLRQRLGPGDAVGRLRSRLGRDPGGRAPDGPRAGGTSARPRGTGPAERTGRPGNRSGRPDGSESRGGRSGRPEDRGARARADRSDNRGARSGRAPRAGTDGTDRSRGRASGAAAPAVDGAPGDRRASTSARTAGERRSSGAPSRGGSAARSGSASRGAGRGASGSGGFRAAGAPRTSPPDREDSPGRLRRNAG